MPRVYRFETALNRVEGDKPPHLLLGNGFSRACRDDIFSYAALFDRADFSALSAEARLAFQSLSTTDFEQVMRALRNAASLLEVYRPQSRALVAELRSDADALREVLISAIAESHPDLPFEIEEEEYGACKAFLSHFFRIFTVNYDLLLYWALMQEEIDPQIRFDDAFRTPEDGPQEYVTWEPENTYRQTVYYVHGALHLFDAGTEVQKYTWVNTGIPLMDQIRVAMMNELYPIFVAEGSSDQKLERIRHSDYLSRAYRSLLNVGGSLFIYGHSFSDQDRHILRLLEKNKVAQLFVSVYGDPESNRNQRLIRKAQAVASARPENRPLSIQFFSAESAEVWG